MHTKDFEKLKFIDGVMDLSRAQILTQPTHNMIAIRDTIGARRGFDYTALVQMVTPTTENTLGYSAIENESLTELYRTYNRLTHHLAHSLQVNPNTDITIRTRFRPDTKATISVILMKTQVMTKTSEFTVEPYRASP